MSDHNNMAGATPEYLTPQQMAELTGFTIKALASMRAKRIGPIFIKVGENRNSVIRYKLEDVRTWFNSHREVTSDE